MADERTFKVWKPCKFSTCEVAIYYLNCLPVLVALTRGRLYYGTVR